MKSKPPNFWKLSGHIEQRGSVDTAHRALQDCGRVFRYAIATGRAERDTAADLRGALPPAKEGHFATITDPEAVGGLLRAIWAYEGSVGVTATLRIAPLVFLRPGELCQAEWSEINFAEAEWRVPASRMKMRQVHTT
jgi:integrase